MMLRLVASLLVVVLVGINAAAQLQEPQEVSTRFGLLWVGKDRLLLFRGRSVHPSVRGNNSLELGPVYRIGSNDIVLVTDNGGTACPYLYYLVTVSKSGAKATPAFGTCAELARIERAGSTLAISMPGFRGPFEPQQDRIKAARERHVFIYRAGVVNERNGKRVR